MAGTEMQGLPRRTAYSSAKRWHVTYALKRAVLVSVLIAAVVVVLGLVIVSPLALRQLSEVHGLYWSQLSNIGQTYGAASALLTGLALIGVVGSMVFQARAIQVSRGQAIREQHTHLIEMALGDPIYQRAWGGLYDAYGSTDRYRQHGYINLIVSFWQKGYALGGVRENAIRDEFSGLFRGEAGRDFWSDTRDMRLHSSESRQDRRFCQIAEEEYQKAITAGPPVIEAEGPSSELVPERQNNTLPNPMIKDGLTLALGIVGGIVFEVFVRHRRR
jgi:hypothetical protein